MSERMDSVESMDEFDQRVDADSDITDREDNLPTAIIVANMDISIFEDQSCQDDFERLFRDLDQDVTFIYLKNFRRARVQFSTSDFAAIARVRLDGVPICGSAIRCYFVQVKQPKADNTFLLPPKPDRMFLISPPASPPVGWEQIPESEPVINYDLLHAIARLDPGEQHEVHPPDINTPAIVVHLCEDPEDYQPGQKLSIVQTRRPDF